MRPHSAGSARTRHTILGRTVVADRPLPGLPLAPSGSPAPLVTLDIHDATDDAPAPLPDACGVVVVDGGPTIALAPDGLGRWTLDVSDTGRWTIAADRIALARRTSADPRAIALDLVGHALPLALHAADVRTLHAAAVTTPAGALLLLAPRGAGKSSLAAACAAAGAPLAADDAAPVAWSGPTPHLLPAGLPLRLRPDVADALALAGDDDGWGKRRVALPLAPLAPTAIAAIAIVTPAATDATLAIDPLPARAAAAHLAAGWKLAPLLGHDDAPAALDAAARLATAVPVLHVAVPRDLGRLRRHAAALLDAVTAPRHAGAVA